MMQRAVQLDPNNRLYHSLLQQYRNRTRSYTTHTYTTQSAGGFSIIGRILFGYIILQLLFSLLRFLFFGFGFMF